MGLDGHANRRRRFVLLFLILVLLCAGGIETWRFYHAYTAMQEGRTLLTGAASLLVDQGLDTPAAALDQQSSDFRRAEDRFRTAAPVVQSDPLISIGGHLPWLSKQVRGVRGLLSIAEDGAVIGQEAVEAVRAFQISREQGSEQVLAAKLSELLDVMEPRVGEIDRRLNIIAATQERMPGSGLLPPLADAVDTLDEYLDEARERVDDYQRARIVVPEFLGFNGPRTFVVLTQDNTELFPTGGLISIYGILSVDQGRITRLSFNDEGELYGAWQARTKEYIPPPGPLNRYLLRGTTWNLGTANWSPDFPTSARDVMTLLQREGGPIVDGVIATNFIVLEELLKLLGPVPMPEYGVTVNAADATEMILEQTHTSRSLVEGKQVFVSRLAERIVSRTLTAEASKWTSLLATFGKLARERQIFLYAKDTNVEGAVTGLGWDGALESHEGDYLMLVEASVNSTKLNLILEEHASLSIRLGADGAVSHRIEVRYTNPYPQWARGKSQALLGQMLGGVYGGYLRIYTPAGSQISTLLHGSQPTAVEDFGSEVGRTWFGSFFVVQPGESNSVAFVYSTSSVVTRQGDVFEYRLVLQKQAGTRALPLAVTVFLPSGATLESASLDGVATAGRLSMQTDLGRDRELVVRFRLGGEG